MTWMTLTGAGGGGVPSRFDFYVDSVNGDDGNDGLTPATAKQSLSEVSLSENLRVGLARGSEWRESVGSPTVALAGVVIGAYGSGRLPILRGDDVLSAGGWTEDGGFTNLFTRTIALAGDYTGNYVSIWIDGIRARWVATKELCDSTPGTFFADTISGTTVAVWVHPTGSTDPTSDGKVYEASVRDLCLSNGTGSSSWDVSDVHTMRSVSNNGSIQLAGPGSIARRVLAEDGTRHNFFIGADCVAEDCIAWKCDWADRANSTAFVAYVTNGVGRSAVFRRCVSVMDPDKILAAIAGADAIEGFYAHTASSANKWDSVVYEDCSVFGATRAFGVLDCVTHENTRPYAEECVDGVGSGALDALILDAYVRQDPGDTVAGRSAYAHAGGDAIVEGLRNYVGPASNQGCVYNLFGSGHSVTLRRSVLVRASGQTGFRFMVNASHASGSITNENNIIQVPSATQETALRAKGSVASENNCYFPSAANFETSGSYADFAAYRAANPGLDVNSAVTDPLLNDPANGDFGVQTGSPAIALGAGLERPNIAYTPIPTTGQLEAM